MVLRIRSQVGRVRESISRIANNFASDYLFYLANIFAKLALFYYVALTYDHTQFVAYNIYVLVSEILLVIVSAGTVTYFASELKERYQLATALLFETVFLGFVALLLVVLDDSFKLSSLDSISVEMVILLSFGRSVNQIYTRYMVFYGRIKRSLINDFLGNFIWILTLPVLIPIYGELSVDQIVGIWISFLMLNNLINCFLYSRKLSVSQACDGLKEMLEVYGRSVQFDTIGNLYMNIEKLIVSSLFANPIIVSSYFMAAKVVGFAVELTTGFINLAFSNRIHGMYRDGQKDNALLVSILVFNLFMFAIMATVLYVFESNIHYLIKTQLADEYLNLLYLILALYMFNSLRNVSKMYFQGAKRYQYLNFVSVAQIATLASLYLFVDDIYEYVLLQILAFLCIVLTDQVYRRNILLSELGSDNSPRRK